MSKEAKGPQEHLRRAIQRAQLQIHEAYPRKFEVALDEYSGYSKLVEALESLLFAQVSPRVEHVIAAVEKANAALAIARGEK